MSSSLSLPPSLLYWCMCIMYVISRSHNKLDGCTLHWLHKLEVWRQPCKHADIGLTIMNKRWLSNKLNRLYCEFTNSCFGILISINWRDYLLKFAPGSIDLHLIPQLQIYINLNFYGYKYLNVRQRIASIGGNIFYTVNKPFVSENINFNVGWNIIYMGDSQKWAVFHKRLWI